MSDQADVLEPEVRTQFNEARQAAELIPVGAGGVSIQNFAQQVDMAKWIAKGGFAIPSHLRDNVGACLAVLDISQRWGFSPYQVARLCYVVKDQLAFMAQLVVAVINKFAPLEGRLRYSFEGEGNNRVCIVRGLPKNETEYLEYRTPPLGKITPKNSPLWESDSDQQLAYLGGTRFCRRHFPEILIGIYSPEELFDSAIAPQHVGADNAKDITPDPGRSLHERLKASQAGSEGFRDGVVEEGLSDHENTARAEALGQARERETAKAAAQTSAEPDKRARKPRSRKPDAPHAPGGEAGESSSYGGAQQAPQESAEQPAGPPKPGTYATVENGTITSVIIPSPGPPGVTLVYPEPKTAAAYISYCEAWIAKSLNMDDAEARYDGERDMRDELNVPIPERNRMVDLIREKFGQ